MKIGRYEILEEIGKGSMGVVYKAHDPNLDLVVALKVLRQDRLSDEAFVRRFLAEAKALGRLDHPGTVRVFNVDEAEGRVYIAMEFIEGESLGDLMKQRRLSPEEIGEIGAKVADALADAHRKGIVHRDVKPSNILIRSDGRVKITDFGIAHIEDLVQGEGTVAGEILGTPSYMSPEQVAGSAVDGRSDLFSLGIILYELSTGRKPFVGDNLAAAFHAITLEPPVDPSKVNPAVPKALEEIVLRCLKKRPEERFSTGDALAAALRGFSEQASGVPAPAPAGGGRRVPVLVIIAALLLVFAAAAGVYYRASVASKDEGSAGSPPNGPPARAPASTSRLTLQTTPAGAQLFVDGAFRGTAPAELALTAGKHEVRVTMPGYNDWEAQVDLREKGETPLSVELVPLDEGRR